MKNVLLISIAIIAVFMIYLGIRYSMLPPALTGVGFLLIVALFRMKKD